MQKTTRFEWIFASEISRHATLRLVDEVLKSAPFTLARAYGRWEGQDEHSWVLVEFRDIHQEGRDRYAVSVGKDLARRFGQEYVLAAWSVSVASLVP